MTQQNNNNQNGQDARNVPQNDDLDMRRLVFQMLRHWYWFVLSVVVALSVAYVYNRYTTPVYEIRSSILIEEKKATSPLSGGMENGGVFQGFSLMGSDYNLYNQMAVLQSKSLISRVMEDLDFKVSYYRVGNIITAEMYRNPPFRVEWDRNHPQVINAGFFVHFLPGGRIRLTVDEEEVLVFDYETEEALKKLPKLTFTTETEAGTRVETANFAFTIFLTDGNDLPEEDQEFKFLFSTKESLVDQYRKKLTVENTPKESSILEVSLLDENVHKGSAFLNKLAEVFQSYNLERKNENASRIIRFITSQLEKITDSLIISEDKMQDFQSKNKIIDISLQTEHLLEQINELDKERVMLETKNKYYKYLRNYIRNNQDLGKVIAPSAMGIEDPLLNSLIAELNTLIVEKSSLTSVKNVEHPKLKRLNAQIESIKNSLLENTNNIISQSELAVADVKKRLKYFEGLVQQLPATEREYVNIQRVYSMNSEIYTFLLEKLAEAQIAKASNTPDNRVVDEAESLGMVKPNKKLGYALALSLGLIIPLLIIFLKDFFNTKVISDEDIKEVTGFPLLGYVYNTARDYKSKTLVLDKPNSPASEPYRAIEHKLMFYTNTEHKNQIIAVTSSYMGEGKTFNAVNIASLEALSKKKTVLVDLDLRRSSLAEIFGLDPNKGLVYYLLGKSSVEEIIFSTKHPYLDVIPAGPIPPNPAELLNGPRLKELFDRLSELYDIVIVDTSPVGAVADTLKLSQLFDTIVFIVRQN